MRQTLFNLLVIAFVAMSDYGLWIHNIALAILSWVVAILLVVLADKARWSTR